MEQPTAVCDGCVQVADIQYQSEGIANIAKALSEMQKTELFALTDSTNPFFNSKYANISSSWDAIRKPLTNNDLAITQITEPFPNGVTIVTILMHKSGEWFKGRLSWEVVKDKHGNRTPQALLSLITYLRRAGVTAITGLCPEDDDGESLMDRETPETTKKVGGKKKKSPPLNASDALPGSVGTDGLGKIKKPGDPPHTELNDDEPVLVDYTLPGEDSQAMKDLKEYKPVTIVLNKEKTHFRVGKFEVMISENGKSVWSNVPKFGDNDFDMDACVPCLVAGLVRAQGVAFISGKYGLDFEKEV